MQKEFKFAQCSISYEHEPGVISILFNRGSHSPYTSALPTTLLTSINFLKDGFSTFEASPPYLLP